MSQADYFDHAAATPLDDEVRAAMMPYLMEMFYNPSAVYLAARQVRRDLEAARVAVARQLGARPAEIVFTAGGTESDNLAIHGVMQTFAGQAVNMVASSIEHDAVLEPASRYERRLCPVTPKGMLDLTALESLIDDSTVLVSVMYANNEIGTIQPIRKIGEIIRNKLQQRRAQGNQLPLYLHSDACQAANYLDLHVAKLGVDLLTLNGGKIYGPKQSGVLYIKTGLALQPQIMGGGQEWSLRSGTENVAGAIGFAAALDRVQQQRNEEADRLRGLQRLARDLLADQLPQALHNGHPDHKLPNNIHITIPNTDNERVMMELDERGLQVAVGSACSASNDEPSHVLAAIGLSEAEAQASLRITMGRATTEDGVRRLVAALAEVVGK